MQSFSSTPATWSAMEKGAAGSVWRPRATAELAIKKCVEWTGKIGIPAMQVVDLETGEVVWRDSRQYPQAGPPIPAGRHEWEKVTSGALDPAALEVGAEKNLIHLGQVGRGEYDLGSPRCEHPSGCRREAVGPFDHYCHRHYFEGCDELWPVERDEQLTLAEWSRS
jgi:hypothetical protein